MKITDIREILKDKRVVEEINRHLWIESQKAGYSIGIERATDEWLRLYAEGWMKYHMPEKFNKMHNKKRKPIKKKKTKAKTKPKAKRKSKNKVKKKTVKKPVKKKAKKKAKPRSK